MSREESKCPPGPVPPAPAPPPLSRPLRRATSASSCSPRSPPGSCSASCSASPASRERTSPGSPASPSSHPAPASGHTYLVTGNRLYLNCTGSGAPTVVLFNGLGERTPSWAWVQANVSAATRVCSFDRAGEGWSGGQPIAQDGPQMASDAHALLAAAHVPGPYVVAGHSVGGTYALVYADQYPSQIAGVALIDSSTPYQFDLPEYPGDYSMMKRAYALMPP